ncbi:MAG: DUF6265 family protein [Chitinophagales bacterium]
MKQLSTLIIGSFLMFFSCVNESNKSQEQAINPQIQLKMKNLHWLIGEWQRTNETPERVSIELWELQENDNLKGVGLTTEGDSVVFKEELSIKIEGEKVHYIADVSHNNEPVAFEMMQLQKNTVVFTNPKHNFPKQIIYTQIAANSMKAVISGNGKEIVFFFKRLK